LKKINEFDKSSPIVRYAVKSPVSLTVTPILISLGSGEEPGVNEQARGI
jgi:hypothetical protein